jgi:hypothetical protein
MSDIQLIPNQAREDRRIMRRPAIISTAAAFFTKRDQNLPPMERRENVRTKTPCLCTAEKSRERKYKAAT